MRPNTVAIVGWFGGGPLPVIRGVQMRPGEVMTHGRDMESYHRTVGSIDYMALALDADELNRTAFDLTGRELRFLGGRALRLSDHAHARLLSLAASARRVARTTPHVFKTQEACHALKQSLTHAMIHCLMDGTPRREPMPRMRRAQIMARFEAVVESHAGTPLHLPELCRLVGVPERTLRKLCQQHLGMGPHRYLFRRRIHEARRALLHADPNAATVAEIATSHGFWELGRFAVRYRSIFGEVPSATLGRAY